MIKNKSPLFFVSCLILGAFCFFYAKEQREKSYSQISIHFLPNPYRAVIPIEIEKETYLLQIDSGSSEGIVLRKEFTDKIQEKSPDGLSAKMDIKGNIYSSKKFKIPKIKIQNLEYSDVALGMEDPYFLEVGSVTWKNPKTTLSFNEGDGRIGMEVLQLNNLYIDLPHSNLCITKDFKTFAKERSFSFSDFIQVPMEQIKKLPALYVQTDKGLKKFLLDTGASHSLLKASLVNKDEMREIQPDRWSYTSDQLVIGGYDFGKTEFFLFELSPKFGGFDGILGIDFFLKYPIFFDFENQKILIQTAKDYPTLFPFFLR